MSEAPAKPEITAGEQRLISLNDWMDNFLKSKGWTRDGKTWTKKGEPEGCSST